MKSAIRNIALASALLATSLSAAEFSTNGDTDSLAPLDGYTLVMENYTAVIYYTVDGNGDYEIVTTVGPNLGVKGHDMQYRNSLSQGQSWSVDLDSGSDGGTIKISVQNDTLILASR